MNKGKKNLVFLCKGDLKSRVGKALAQMDAMAADADIALPSGVRGEGVEGHRSYSSSSNPSMYARAGDIIPI